MQAEGESKDGEATGLMTAQVWSVLEQMDMKCRSGQEHGVVQSLRHSLRMWL